MTTNQQLTQTDIAVLYNEIDNGNKNARDYLIESHLALVDYMARRFANSGLENDDLVGIGKIGLIKGIDNFNPTKGSKLSTYICVSIKGLVLNELRKQRKHVRNVSIHSIIGHSDGGEDLTLEDIIGTDTDEICSKIVTNEKISVVKEALNQLTSIEKTIILLRHGLDDDIKVTREKIANILGETPSNVFKQEQQALIKMRHPRITKKLKEYI